LTIVQHSKKLDDGNKMMDGNKDFRLHDRVQINKTGEIAFIVWYDEEYPAHDSFLLEIMGEDEMPKFYERKDFEVLGD